MNPSLRLRAGKARPAALLVLAAFALALPLHARSRSLEIQAEPPYVLSIIDDPDPTGRLRRRPVLTGDERPVSNRPADPSGASSALYTTAMPAPIAVWSRDAGTGFDIVLSRFVRGIWTRPETLADSPADELDPRLTVDPDDGSVHLVYWVDRTEPFVVHRSAPADLSSWSAPRVVSAPGEDARRPSACFDRGVLRVAYESHGPREDGTPRLIVAATMSELGILRQVVATSLHPFPAWPRLHAADGRVWVDWIDGAGRLAWRRERPDASWEPVEVEPFDGREDRELARGRVGLRARE